MAHLRRRLLGDPRAGGPEFLRAASGQGVEALVASRDTPEVAATRFATPSGAGFSAGVWGALAEAGVPAAVLKGAPVAHLAWDDPTLRPQATWTCWSSRGGWRTPSGPWLRGSAARGSDPFSHHDHLEDARPGGLLVELHRNLALDGPLRCDVSAVLRRRIRALAVQGEWRRQPRPFALRPRRARACTRLRRGWIGARAFRRVRRLLAGQAQGAHPLLR